MKQFTAEEFKILTGFAPEHDDLERTNCDKAGDPTHTHCGFCNAHLLPRFVCGCFYDKRQAPPGVWVGLGDK